MRRAALALLVAAAGCGQGGGAASKPEAGAPPVRCAASLTAKPGETTETISVGGLSRSFILHVPPGYTGKEALPLVVDFHPLTLTASLWKQITTWGATADARGFLVAWPQGYMDSWNAGRCCGEAVDAGVDDVAFTRAMIAQISGEACVDPKRVYATGCSNGGGMSYRVACDAADTFAAVAPVDFDCVTGATNDPSCASCSPSRPIAEIQFRGTNDGDVPYDGGPTPVVSGLVFPGAAANFATWAGIDRCAGAPSPEPGQGACESYASCAGGAEVTLCTVQGGTHCGSYGIFPIVDTAWSAFEAHALP